VARSLRATKLLRTAFVSSLLLVGLLSGFFVVLPLAHAAPAHAQSTVMVSETLGAGNFSGAPGYSPDRITVVVGVNNTITWTNNDVGHNHTVTSMLIPTGATPFNSGNMVKNAVYTVTLTVPGLYRYGCTYHPWMGGIIDVVAAKSSSTGGPEISGFPLAYLAVIIVVVVALAVVAVARLRASPRRESASQGAKPSALVATERSPMASD
jgi:plastocyanin